MLNQILWGSSFVYINIILFITICIFFLFSIYFLNAFIKDIIVDYLPNVTNTLSFWKSLSVVLVIILFIGMINYT